MKKVRVFLILLFIAFLFLFSKTEKQKEKIHYEWNGGYCIEDGGRLNYISTGSKTHYQCDICGKEYTFEGVQKYE